MTSDMNPPQRAMQTSDEANQPAGDNAPAQGPPAEQAGARPSAAVPPATASPTALSAGQANAPAGAAQMIWAILLVVSLGLASGAAGALLSSRVFPPAPPMRVGTISLTRLTRAVAGAQPANSASFVTRFDAVVKRLVEAEPGLVLFVKEAVIDTGQIEDYTDAILPLLGYRTPPPPPGTEGPDGQPADHAPRATQRED